MRVLVLGGYGNFGARICRSLSRDADIDLLVAGRDLRKAQKLARELDAGALRSDATSLDLARQLREQAIALVIHTAGPFQAQNYHVAAAAASAGSHYIDLADGRRFVCDFPRAMDASFRATSRCGISGASTVPALSSAVIDVSLARFKRLDDIDICIAPAQQAPRGEATLAGVLSYCGAPIQVWQDGSWRPRIGWARPERVQFAGLKPRLGALCDIPDLELFPSHYAVTRGVMFRAALEVGATQRVFALLAWLRSRGWPFDPARLAKLLYRAGGIFDPFGTPAGGMVVRLTGQGVDGQRLRLAWHITAGDHHGPEIPCMAAIILARRLARGDTLATGASTAMNLVRLEEFGLEFNRWGMLTQWSEEDAHGA